MIWMELTRTDIVFSRIAMMLFYVQKTKVLEMTWNSMEYLTINNKKSPPKMKTSGPTPFPRGWGARPLPRGPPGGSLMTIFSYMKSFVEKKNKNQPFGTKLRRHKAEPWQIQSRTLAELFCRGNFPPEGGNYRHRHHQRSSHRERAISINIFINTISSQNLVHLLYPILVSKSGIGASRLLVVLITPCSWC